MYSAPMHTPLEAAGVIHDSYHVDASMAVNKGHKTRMAPSLLTTTAVVLSVESVIHYILVPIK